MKIKANHITIARILFLPIPCYFIFLTPTYQILALFLFVVLGATDWFDGWLARKEGSTVLGSLLDPIADKIFVALTFIPMAIIGLVPWWVTFLIFVREFVITVLRSLTARANINFKTSQLAKYKTAIQMAGAGFMLWLKVMDNYLFIMYLSLIIMTILGLMPAIINKFVRHRPVNHRMISAPLFFGVVPLFRYLFGLEYTLWIAIFVILFFTYASGIQYIWNLILSIKQAASRRSLSRFIVTLFEGILLPLGIIFIATIERDKVTTDLKSLISSEGLNIWLPMVIITVELGVGGLDNLLANLQKIRSVSWIWMKGIALSFFEVILFLKYYEIIYISSISMNLILFAILFVCGVYAFAEFYKHRHDYL